MADIHEVEILVVEDNPDHAELILRVLRKYHVTNHFLVARDGQEALDFLFARGTFAGRSLQRGPKLLLLDLKLPRIDGLEVLKQVKSDPATKAIPVVVLTSSQEEWDISECYKLGVNSYIVKPVTFEGLVNAVSEVGLYWTILNTSAKTLAGR
jgi:CheY-like chemotaxis protein